MRQQLLDSTGGLRGQALEHVFQVVIRFVPIEPRPVHEAHDSYSRHWSSASALREELTHWRFPPATALQRRQSRGGSLANALLVNRQALRLQHTDACGRNFGHGSDTGLRKDKGVSNCL